MPTGEGPRVTTPGRTTAMRRRIRDAATERLGYKAASLFFALVLWLVVSTEEPAEQLVPVRLSLELDSTLELRGERPQLRALVAGRGRTLLALFDTPPVVRRAFAAGTPDSVRIAVRPTDVELPPGVEATVRDIQPRTLTLRFRRELPAATGAAMLPLADTAVIAVPDALPSDSALDAEGFEAPPGVPPQNHDTAARPAGRNRDTAGRTGPSRRAAP